MSDIQPDIKPPDKPPKPTPTGRPKAQRGPTGGILILCPCGVILHQEAAHIHLTECKHVSYPQPLDT